MPNKFQDIIEGKQELKKYAGILRCEAWVRLICLNDALSMLK
jgi:hypothetical protein